MKVTKFDYPLEKNLIKKIDLMIKRCTTKKSKKDAVLIIDGEEGEGKTTLSIAIAYYVADKTGRKFSVDHVFFNLRKLIKFAQSNKNQIIVWDEPALQALSTDAQKAVVKDLTRLLMMARKKRHFLMINTARFYKFNEYAVVDRPVGMVHVYSRKNIYSGRFIYIYKKLLEPLYRDCKYKKQKNYKKYGSKRIRGTFPDILNPDYKNNVLSDFKIKKYERKKNRAIMKIGKPKKNKWKEKWRKERVKRAKDIKSLAEKNDLTIKDAIKFADMNRRTFYTALEWGKKRGWL